MPDNNNALTTDDLALLSQTVNKRQAFLAEQQAKAQEKKELQRAARTKQQKEVLGEVNQDIADSTPEHRISIVESVKRETLVKPHIPTEADAKARGLICPRLEDYQWAIGASEFTIPNDVELPAEPDALELLAYSILPAFLHQYGLKYKARYGGRIPHTMIAKQWVQAMTAQDEKSANKVVLPHELRFVVDRMASQSEVQDFNPRLMMGHALELRRSDDTAIKKMLEESIADTYARLSGHEYFFYRTVAPAPEFELSDWATMTGYPHYFAMTDIPQSVVRSVNSIVHYRFATEPEFNPIMGRWLAKTLLTTIGCFISEGKPLPLKHIFTLAYRYACSYIQEVHPHDASFYTKPSIPKFVPPAD